MPSPKAPSSPLDTALVRELAGILDETGLSEIEVERDGLKIRVAKALTASAAVFAQPAASPAAPSPAAATPSPPPSNAAAERTHAGDVVTSPMVGTVYLQPQPGSPPFAKAGDKVTAGQTLLLVEAMKTMNPITAPKDGELLEYLVADAQPVEYGEPLVVIGA